MSDEHCFDLVVAADRERGIAKGGMIPWRLPSDMRYFKKLTRETRDPECQNAVLMGRKTWESLPDSARPLRGRINVVLSREQRLQLPVGVWHARSFDAALAALGDPVVTAEVENIFVIGGAEIYATAMQRPDCRYIYYTRVAAVFDCDVSFPMFERGFVCEALLQSGTDGGLDYRIERWVSRRWRLHHPADDAAVQAAGSMR